MVKTLSLDNFRTYLRSHGVADATQIENIVNAFDQAAPIYRQPLDPGTVLYQFLRNPSFGKLVPKTGHWFCLSGATADALAIFGGLAGRHRNEYHVALSLVAVEGTAASMSRNWRFDIGGSGGATQIYIPPALLHRVMSIGAANG